MKTHAVVISAVLAVAALHAQQAPAPSAPQTPAQCLAETRAFVTKRQQEMRPLTSEIVTRINAERAAMVKECTAKFDVNTIAEKELSSLSDLYADAGQLDLANAALERGLKSTTLTETDRATLLAQAIGLGLREPKGDERNARLEILVDKLDAMPDAAALDQKITAHSRMNGYYRADDIDAGIIKHSTWLINRGETLAPALRAKYGYTIVSAYVNMAEAWAGQAMNDKAIALLKRAPVEWADVPRVETTIEPVLARYKLVGTEAATITAPQWLNMPAGKTDLSMKGAVTLLEFTAHWCGPCKESYPGINRLRQQYGSKGFRVVFATRLYGYFERETNLDAATEFERDRAYFAEHHLDVPVAVTGRITASVQNGQVVYSPGPDPNDTAYKVGGIPQIHLIDKQGRIRLIMVGYDDLNEPKLAKLIEGMLAEK